MIPAAFEYHRPRGLAEALALLAEHGDDAKLLAGGHSLIPTMKARLSQPGHLIDLAAIEGLRGISCEAGFLRIGAMTTHWQVESSAVVKSALPVLNEVASLIADPQVRNRGTMGGSVSNADPAADYPASILAFEAELVCVSEKGERVVAGNEWFQALFTTALQENEILREIRFPLPAPQTVSAYLKLPHPASRFAIVGVAVALILDEANKCTRARIGITGAGAYARRAENVEAALVGNVITPNLIDNASEGATVGLEINEDIHFSADDRRQLCRVYVRRAIAEALNRRVKSPDSVIASHGSNFGPAI